MCKGFVFKSEDQETDVRAAQEAWELAEQTMAANQHQLVILDELTYLIKFPVSYYPEWIQWLIALLPLTHASHAIRAAVLTQPLPALSFVYLVLFALVVFGFAVRVVQLSQN